MEDNNKDKDEDNNKDKDEDNNNDKGISALRLDRVLGFSWGDQVQKNLLDMDKPVSQLWNSQEEDNKDVPYLIFGNN